MIKQYPITFACGSLVLVFIVPKATAFGLVGIERAFLSFLLELEQLLVVAFLTGAKWVRSNLNTHKCGWAYVMNTCSMANVGIPRTTSAAGDTGWRYCWCSCTGLV